MAEDQNLEDAPAVIGEYFRYVFEEVLTEEDRLRLKEAIARAPRPGPVRSSLTREDYMEMSATWDKSTCTRYSQREMHRVVHSMTVQNKSQRTRKRVTFGHDPTLRSDR